ncbi:L,D-transpeptidase family protein [Agriterribacter sp.]|uniref:L,D-transpeptidase family protein n=1 Tax=Agriterribacter sp. TaxID=2821509 RepID=UPI002B723A1D|nr:L,D-transpeptidase family protein [Agriterribacter sp.]HTN06220.1 L,D-transpeptidase family protein [Agriterribacter sp.]
MIKQCCKSICRILVPVLLLFACNEASQAPKAVEMVSKPENLNKKTNENIAITMAFASEHNGKLNDSLIFNMLPVVKLWYTGLDSLRTWSDQERWLPMADSLYYFIRQSEKYGLFPSDYHFSHLDIIHHKLKTDSTAMLDAAMWARGDLLFTDAFMQIVKDIKLGRLEKDSVTLRKDSVITDSFYVALLKQVHSSKALTPLLEALEPHHEGYVELRGALKSFLDSMNRTKYTYLYYPFTDPADSLNFIKNLQTRLYEGGYISFNDRAADTAALTAAVKGYQKENDLKVDGKAGTMVVKSLNNNDQEKFKTIAINLDRYKQLPDTMPQRYLWVNIPAYQLRLWDTDTLKLESKIIVGQPQTRTPLLTSTLTNFIIFPQWTVPYSIIFKEMLPKIRENVAYLDKQNLMVVDKNDSIIDPHTINWFRLNKNYFPYLLKQREGDDNSLGVIKFNFRNKYSVYLHDTNARWLFSKTNRALSHGCVRVQQWDKLSKYLVKNDSLRYKPDTLAAWMKRKEKHTVNFSQKIPIFIRYITCEARDGRLVFFDDVYAEDKMSRQAWFSNKYNLLTL